MRFAPDQVLARLEGVRECAGYYIARCPAHPDRKASLSIRESENCKVLIKCFAGCDYRAIVSALNGRSWRQPFQLQSAFQRRIKEEDDTSRTEYALRIWRDSQPAAGTLAEKYLKSRRITIALPSTLRFAAALKHPSGAHVPALIAGVQNRDGRIVAIHRTWISPDGSGKANLDPQKMALGPIARGALRLAPAGEVLCLCEGIEDAMTVLQVTSMPTWAGLGANIARVELSESVREVIICADNDASGEGERLARRAAEKFWLEGRRVRIARPDGAKDYNELLQGIGR